MQSKPVHDKEFFSLYLIETKYTFRRSYISC
jgi:hypothetical protein